MRIRAKLRLCFSTYICQAWEVPERSESIHRQNAVLAVSASTAGADKLKAVRAGPSGYLSKEESLDEVVEAIKAVACGQSLEP